MKKGKRSGRCAKKGTSCRCYFHTNLLVEFLYFDLLFDLLIDLLFDLFSTFSPVPNLACNVVTFFMKANWRWYVHATTYVRNRNSLPIKSQIVSYDLRSLSPLNNFQHFVGFSLFVDSKNSSNEKSYFLSNTKFFLHIFTQLDSFLKTHTHETQISMNKYLIACVCFKTFFVFCHESILSKKISFKKPKLVLNYLVVR